MPRSFFRKTKYDLAGAPSRQASCRGWSAVRSVATPSRAHRRARAHAKFTTISALAPIAGENWAAPICDNRRFVRQDLLDQIVWAEVIRLLEEPILIQQELDRRLAAARSSDPTKKHEQSLQRGTDTCWHRHRTTAQRLPGRTLVDRTSSDILISGEINTSRKMYRRQTRAPHRSY